MIIDRGLVRQVEQGACLDVESTPVAVFPSPIETLGPAARRMADAQCLARSHVSQLQAALAQITRLAVDVADGGAAYPAGVRNICERLAEEAAGRSRQIQGVLHRRAEAVGAAPVMAR